jgi:hypothetical protein
MRFRSQERARASCFRCAIRRRSSEGESRASSIGPDMLGSMACTRRDFPAWVGAIAVALAATSVLAFVGAVTVASGSTGAKGRSPKVICITKFKGTRLYGTYRYRPQHCVLHQRYKSSASVYLMDIVRVHWKRWDAQKAVGKGKYWVEMNGPVKAKFKLAKPRTSCGQRLFTEVQVRYRLAGHRYRFHRPIDRCLV